MRRAIVLIAYAFLVGCTSMEPVNPPDLAITGVNIVDVENGRVLTDRTVIVSGTRITAILRSGTGDNGAGRVVDARGKFLIPGLWDMHVHLFNNAVRPGTHNRELYFPLFIAHGVTGVRDMWTDPADNVLARQWRSDIDAGRSFGPRIATGSSIIDGVPANWPNSESTADPDSARAIVRREIAAGAGFIKVYTGLSRATYRAIADEARRARVPIAGHVPRAITATEASSAGQRTIEHLTDMLASCSRQEAEMRRGPDNRARSMLSVSAYDPAKCRTLGHQFARNRTAHTPTLILHSGRLIAPFARAADPRLRFVSGDEARGWRAVDAQQSARDPALLRGIFDTFGRVVADLHRGGTTILAGTDLGNPHVYAGSSLHDELVLLVEAGLSPRDALAAATLNPARVLGLEASLGSIEAGKLADLVILDANPLESIRNVRRISGVISNGRYFSAPELMALQEEVGRAVPAPSSPR